MSLLSVAYTHTHRGFLRNEDGWQQGAVGTMTNQRTDAVSKGSSLSDDLNKTEISADD